MRSPHPALLVAPETANVGKPAGSFTVALGDQLKARLLAAAKAAATKPAVLVRRAISEALRDPLSEVQVPAPVSRPGETLKEIRVRVPESVAVRLAAAACASGMTRSAYLSAATAELTERSGGQVGKAPMHGIETAGALREALVKSNATLAPIGRNLNQVARALNTHPQQVSAEDRRNLAEAVRRVSEHLELASELLRVIRVPRSANAGPKTAARTHLIP